MTTWLKKAVTGCLGPVRSCARMNKDEQIDSDDALIWSRDIEKHSVGEYSFAVVQANENLEDHSQVETSPVGTFVGVYDGHGGADTSKFIREHLFEHIIRLANESRTISQDVVKNAFALTEEGFLTLVRRTRDIKPIISAVGSCCLIGFIWEGKLHVANVGDSRAVIGCVDRSNNIIAEQITRDHNASMEEVRQEIKEHHPDDPNIVVLKHGVWRIKGIIQVSRTIGDAYLKSAEFIVDPSIPKFRLSEPIRRPVLSAEPSVYTRALRAQDKFLIFASDGLWEHLSNQEAAEIVYSYPRQGIARRLIRAAMHEAARKREVRYKDLKKVEKGIRRFFHDDITVVVVFIDHEFLQSPNASIPELSVRGFVDAAGPSKFSGLANMDC